MTKKNNEIQTAVVAGFFVVLAALITATAPIWTASPDDSVEDSGGTEQASESHGNQSPSVNLSDADGNTIVISGTNATSAQSEEVEPVLFVEIPHLQERLSQLQISNESPSVSLKFRSEQWGIDHTFVANTKLKVSDIGDTIMKQLQLLDHVSLNRKLYPDSPKYRWHSYWTLLINGGPVGDAADKSLEQAGITAGSVLQFRLTWTVVYNTSFDSSRTEPTAPSPPPPVGL